MCANISSSVRHKKQELSSHITQCISKYNITNGHAIMTQLYEDSNRLIVKCATSCLFASEQCF